MHIHTHRSIYIYRQYIVRGQRSMNCIKAANGIGEGAAQATQLEGKVYEDGDGCECECD